MFVVSARGCMFVQGNVWNWGRNLSTSTLNGFDAPSKGVWRHGHDLKKKMNGGARKPVSLGKME
jgi:hypothetical protein